MNRINLICLGVRDIKKSLRFYRDIGFQTYEKADAPPIVFFDNQGTKLELYSLEELAKDINGQTPPPLSPGGLGGIILACNMKSEAEVDAAMEKVKQHGGSLLAIYPDCLCFAQPTVQENPQEMLPSGPPRNDAEYVQQSSHLVLW